MRTLLSVSTFLILAVALSAMVSCGPRARKWNPTPAKKNGELSVPPGKYDYPTREMTPVLQPIQEAPIQETTIQRVIITSDVEAEMIYVTFDMHRVGQVKGVLLQGKIQKDLSADLLQDLRPGERPVASAVAQCIDAEKCSRVVVDINFRDIKGKFDRQQFRTTEAAIEDMADEEPEDLEVSFVEESTLGGFETESKPGEYMVRPVIELSTVTDLVYNFDEFEEVEEEKEVNEEEGRPEIEISEEIEVVIDDVKKNEELTVADKEVVIVPKRASPTQEITTAAAEEYQRRWKLTSAFLVSLREEVNSGRLKHDQAVDYRSKNRVRDAEGEFTKPGHLENADQLEPDSPFFTWGTNTKNSKFATSLSKHFIEYVGKKMLEKYPGTPLSVNRCTDRDGGSIAGDQHDTITHRNGLDCDIDFPSEGNKHNGGNMVDKNGEIVDKFEIIPKTWTMLKLMEETDAWDRVGINSVIVDGIVEQAEKEGELESHRRVLDKVCRFGGHTTHMHAQLKCTSFNPRCQDSIPTNQPGSGCDRAL